MTTSHEFTMDAFYSDIINFTDEIFLVVIHYIFVIFFFDAIIYFGTISITLTMRFNNYFSLFFAAKEMQKFIKHDSFKF